MKSENAKTVQEIEEFEGFTARDKKGEFEKAKI